MTSRYRNVASIGLALLLAGCGTESNPRDDASHRRPEPKAEKPSAAELARTCSDETGQNLLSEGAPIPGFVACLKQLDAPRWLVDAWVNP